MIRPGVLVLGIALGAALVGCGVSSPILGVGPVTANDPHLLDEALGAARDAGYRPTALDPEAGRFEVVARSDRRGATRFVVQCFADGFVSVLPVGPGVSPDGDRLRMSRRLRDEYGTLAAALERAIGSGP